MKKKLVNAVLACMTLSLLAFNTQTAMVSAQEEGEVTGYKDVRLWVNPEYDDPRLLIMLEGEIVGAEPPAQVQFLVPSGAEMYSAGSMDAQRNYSGGPPQRDPSGTPGWDIISYNVTTSTFRVEYYDPIILGSPDKTISYQFRHILPIENMTAYVQEPLKSSNFIISKPGPGQTFTDNDGLTTHYYTFTNLDPEQSLDFNLSYTRTVTTPSLQTSTGGAMGNSIAVVLGILAVLGLLAGGIWWIRKSSRPKSRSARRQAARTNPGRAAARTSPAPLRSEARTSGRGQTQTRFCSQCGESIDPSDKFCASCGSQVGV